MKVFILTEGGINVGFGHVTRCIALYQAIEDKGHSPELVINADDSILDFVENSNCQLFNWVVEQGKIICLIKDADFVIIDSYLAQKPLYDKISEITNGNLLMIDDYNRIEYPSGIVVNPSICGDKLNYSCKDGITYLLGKSYAIIRKEFWKIPKKNINKKVRNVLITFGGIKREDLINKIVGYLKEIFKFDFYIVGSSGNKLSAKQMLDLMLKVDICISGGGQTTYELARVGVPTIGICFAENQLMNLKGWEKEGILQYAGWYNDKDLIEKISNGFNNIQSYSKRDNLNQAGKSCIDGRGAERLAQVIQEKVLLQNREDNILLKFRNVTKDDCRDIWHWRNHPQVRKVCYETKPLRYSDHQRWFSDKINNDSTNFFIAENKNKQKIGQVRFEKNSKNAACINVNLNPNFFGRGLGSKIIKNATEYFMNNYPEIKNITAEILDSNIISQKAFKSAGYKFHKYIILKDKKTSIFKFTKAQ